MTTSLADRRGAPRLTFTILALAVGLGACGDHGADGGPVLDDAGMPLPDAGLGDLLDAGPGDGGPPDGGSPDVPYTEAEVQQLFDVRGCSQAGCHAAATRRAGLSLEGFAADTVGVRSTQSTLDRIEPGDHQTSYLWHKVNGTHRTVGGSGSRMPLSRLPLDEVQIQRLAGYIDALSAD